MVKRTVFRYSRIPIIQCRVALEIRRILAGVVPFLSFFSNFTSMGSTQRKKLDSRIPTLIANGVDNKHRSFFVVVGDRGKDQVVTLHYLLSKARVSARPNVLWCYKKDLGFTR